MASFTTRVELHDGKYDDYVRLHEAMQQKGFLRRIQADDGWYELPWAEYNYVGNETAERVRDAATAAARSTGKTFCVLVTEGRRYWHGLKKVG